jgi:carboxypeptidase family protein
VTSGPSRMSAVTGEDGGYEMIAEEPGQKRLVTESADGRVSYPARSVDVPDADTYTLDVAFATATLPGVVLDKDTQKPISRAQVSASPKGPRQTGGSSARTGDDGRFQLELEPGDYRVRASADDYGSAEADTSVGTAGGNDVTLTLGRGLSVSGRVVDSRGRGIGGLPVMARGQTAGGYATTRQDGTFSMAGLTAGRYSLSARSEQGAFAVAAGVMAGDKDVVLTLRPGGRVTVRVLGLDGQPVEGAQVFAPEVSSFATTGATGTAELAVPAGRTALHVSKERLDADATVEVGEGGTAAMDAKLEAAPPAGSR